MIELKLEGEEQNNQSNSQVQVVENKVEIEQVQESSLDYTKLNEEEQKQIDEFMEKIDVKNTSQIISYGSSAQNNISKFSDTVLNEVKTKDTGKAGDLLSTLVSEIKSFEQDSNSIMSSKGLFGSAKKQLTKLVARYNKVENNINTIEKMLESQRLSMLKDIATFDNMYDKNIEYFQELSMYIIAGEEKLKQLRQVELPQAQEKARQTNDQLDVQAAKDLADAIDRFDKKLYDLKTTRMISMQMAPQIRLIQNNDSELVNKIQSSLINTIPLWKNQMVISLGLTNAKNVLDTQRKVTNLTNEMLKSNSEMLKQGSIEVAQESQRAVVDIETLQQTNQNLIDTIDGILHIQQEGKAKREAAQVELAKLESELKQKLMDTKSE